MSKFIFAITLSLTVLTCLAEDRNEAFHKELVLISKYGGSSHVIGEADGYGKIIRHKKGKGLLNVIRIVRGLDDKNLVSLESAAEPGLFLRHQNHMLKWHKADASGPFAADATFNIVKGLAGKDTVSFRSHNEPDRYITITRKKELKLFTNPKKSSASFKLTIVEDPTKKKPSNEKVIEGKAVGEKADLQNKRVLIKFDESHVIGNVDDFGDVVKHEEGNGLLNVIKIVPGLDDKSLVSLESVTDPGVFLRHQHFKIHWHRTGIDRTFNADATFKVVKGLSGEGTVSFMSHNMPGYYLTVTRKKELQMASRPDKNQASFQIALIEKAEEN